MRLKRILAAGAAAILAATLLPASPASADAASARAWWRDYALAELAEIEADRSLPACENLNGQLVQSPGDHPTGDPNSADCERRTHEAWIRAYQASLTAFRDGWTDPDVASLLNEVYSQKIAGAAPTRTDRLNTFGGYGETYNLLVNGQVKNRLPRNTGGDSVADANDTVYTVTMTDHVGEPLLEGYRAGIVPLSEMTWLATAIWNQPVLTFSEGGQTFKCVAYSDSNTDQDYCALNVSLGAAAFMQSLRDEGILPTGVSSSQVTTWINDLKPFGSYSYELNDPANFVDRPTETENYVREGYWPYLYYLSTADATPVGGAPSSTQQGRFDNIPQDWNHNAYTIESARTLGLTKGGVNVADNATQDVLDIVDYTIDNYANKDDYSVKVDQEGRGVQGRMRLQGLYPNYKPRHAKQDAGWYKDEVNHWKANTTHAQGGRWAARLAGNAYAGTELAREVTFMTTPRVYPTNWNGSLGQTPLGAVNKGQTYIVYTDAREGSSAGWGWLTATPVRLFQNGSLHEIKDTGFDTRGVRFIWTAPSSGTSANLCARVLAGQDSTYISGCNSVDLN